jgi:hypothetical protein
MATIIKPKKKSIPKVVKDLSWNKWVGEDIAKTKCMCCSINEIKMNSFHCGHVIAEANGGKTTVDNLRPICAACNLSMGTENLDDFKKRCGFNSSQIQKAIEKPKPSEDDVKKEKINKLLISGEGKCTPYTKGVLTKCPGKLICSYNSYQTHCGICKNHYCNIMNKSCPCKSV